MIDDASNKFEMSLLLQFFPSAKPKYRGGEKIVL